MKTMKKVATILLALLLVLCTMSIGVSAVGETGSIDIKITADKTTEGKVLYPGDIVTFTINITNNFNYVAMRWPVIYPSKAFEPVIVGDGDASFCNVQAHGSLTSGESSIESSEFNSDLITGSYGGVNYNKNNYAGILIQWTGKVTSDGIAYYNEPSGANCITFQLRVQDGFAGIGTKRDGIAPVTIPQINNVKSQFYYQGVQYPEDPGTLYKMNASSCPVTVEGVTTKVIKEDAALVPKEGTDIIFDTEGEVPLVYGFNELVSGELGDDMLDDDNLSEFISKVGGAEYTVEANDQQVYSTGAVIHATDANGQPIGDYTIVIFGDVNGDGIFDGQDCMMLSDVLVGGYEWSWGDIRDDARAMACDVYGNGYIFTEDYGPLVATVSGLGYLDQTHSSGNPFIAR